MPLPPELQERIKRGGGDVQVSLKIPEGGRAVIEGKTGVPFGVFVKLILKKKVQALFKDWQEEPVIIPSSLLTHLASAPEDRQEDRSKVILTALVIGFAFGMFLTAVTIVVSSTFGLEIGSRELLAGMGVLLALAVIVVAAMKIHTHKARQQLVEQIEQIADIFSK